MKKSLNGFIASLLVMVGVLVLASNVSAAGPTKAQVDGIITRVEQNLDAFVNMLDTSLDNSGLNGTNREDYLNSRTEDLEKATDELRSEFDRRDSWIENKAEVRKCLDIATDINVAMKNRHLGAATEKKWAKVRFELNRLADAYNLPKVGSSAY